MAVEFVTDQLQPKHEGVPSPVPTGVLADPRNVLQWRLPSFRREGRFQYVSARPQGADSSLFAEVAPPSSPSIWLIGYIQNALRIKVEAVWGGKKVSVLDQEEPVLDSVASIYSPFYADPSVLQVQLPPALEQRRRRMLKKKTGRRISGPLYSLERYEAVLELIAATSGRFGRLYDPFSQSGIPVDGPTHWNISFEDEPKMTLPRYYRGGSLSEARYMIVLQSWLVIQTPEQGRIFVNHCDPITLWSWVKTQKTRGPQAQQIVGWRSLGARGIHQSPPDNPGENWLRQHSQIRRHSGKGGREPVLNGETANDIIKKNLAPFSIQWQRQRNPHSP